jgi:hypothetical protein
MFGPKHYVPILRWKQAERFALKHLLEVDRKMITPLIEITPKVFDAPKTGKDEGKKPDPARVLEDQAKNLLESWENAPLFLDLGLVDGLVPPINGVRHPLVHIAEIARSYRLCVVPVTGLNRRNEYQSALSDVVRLDGRGICLRLLAKDLAQPGYSTKLKALLRKVQLNESSVDLLLDYQTFDRQNPDVKDLLGRIPNLRAWRSLTIASGAFPADLQKRELGSSRISRDDWLSWKEQFFDESSTQRRASFSDYTIQYGLYKEPVEHCIPSVSVRYTLENEWLIMRGEAPRKKASSESPGGGPGLEQWYGHAQLLCEKDDLFYGENFSWGDAFIYQKSARQGKPGSYEIWLRAGINHHMTVVSRQLANLAAP